MRIKQLTNADYNNKKYTDFNAITKIFKQLGFKVIGETFIDRLKAKDFRLTYKNKSYITRVPTNYEFLNKLHDNVLNLFIKDMIAFNLTVSINNSLPIMDKYKDCIPEIKEKLIDNQIIKLTDPLTDRIYYIADYNFAEKYGLIDASTGTRLKMDEETIKNIFRIKGDKK